MSHHNTVFSQLLKLIPRHEFETLSNQHHSGRSFRTATRWSQFISMAMAQLSGRNSLRDIANNWGQTTIVFQSSFGSQYTKTCSVREYTHISLLVMRPHSDNFYYFLFFI